MKESTDKSTILSETAVFEFVADKQSSDTQRNFEALIEQDPQLQHEIEIERELRKALAEDQQSAPVSMDNFDALLAKIDELEDQQGETPSNDNVTELAAQRKSERATNNRVSNVISLSTLRSRQFSIAASVAVLGIVFAAFMSSGYLEPNAEQNDDFVLLSSPKQVNFLELSDQGRVAKLVLVEELSNTKLANLLSSYQLQQFKESGASVSSLYVYTEKAITDQQLALLKADERIQQVAVFSPNPVEE